MSNEADAALERLKVLESLYEVAAAHVDAAETAAADLESMAASLEPLMEGYHHTWAEDREAVEGLDPQLAVLGEDTIWNLHSRRHEVMVRMMRLCADYFAGDK
ncbi:Uncharacterised protein [Actinomyces bovis]|uniref:DUF4298 domain-containing protein n=1 Tax=Actinomyces bovis TaxID=1658 RepID=A0ABY1VKS1_9ACTO|nr:DUF4298 domain-containing protein [Actinomyces bovis]SPT52509.1 Uncharacterised protein [Actinomyces bovis]VEG54232.1 Uncharacterised protein [Actinomyces israelii]